MSHCTAFFRHATWSRFCRYGISGKAVTRSTIQRVEILSRNNADVAMQDVTARTANVASDAHEISILRRPGCNGHPDQETILTEVLND